VTPQEKKKEIKAPEKAPVVVSAVPDRVRQLEEEKKKLAEEVQWLLYVYFAFIEELSVEHNIFKDCAFNPF
jgi:hypothetical protein